MTPPRGAAELSWGRRCRLSQRVTTTSVDECATMEAAAKAAARSKTRSAPAPPERSTIIAKRADAKW